MEDADEVLAVGGVDAGLAADRGIDLRQKRGGHLDEIHAAPDDAGGEAREVSDHAAAERDHRVAALQPRREHAVDDLLQGVEALGLLAGRKHDRRRFDAAPGKAFR